MKVTIGMSEILLAGSVYVYQEAFIFSMVLLGLSMLGKGISFGHEIQQKKESAEAGKELTQNLMDSLMNAVTLSGIAHGTKSKKNGYH